MGSAIRWQSCCPVWSRRQVASGLLLHMQMLLPLAPHGLETSRERDRLCSELSLTTHGINLLHTLQQITALINMCGKLALLCLLLLLFLLQQVSSKGSCGTLDARLGALHAQQTETTATYDGTVGQVCLSLIPNKSVICN